MVNRMASFGQHTPNEQSAVTVSRVFLAAHDCNAVAWQLAPELNEPAEEIVRLRQLAIQDVAG